MCNTEPDTPGDDVWSKSQNNQTDDTEKHQKRQQNSRGKGEREITSGSVSIRALSIQNTLKNRQLQAQSHINSDSKGIRKGRN
jgi:hypothetical protein